MRGLIIIFNNSVSYLFNEIKASNNFKINIFQILIFLFKTKNQVDPTICSRKFQSNAHQYPRRFSKHSFFEPNRDREFPKSQFQVTRFWNKILPVSVKGLATRPLLKAIVKY